MESSKARCCRAICKSWRWSCKKRLGFDKEDGARWGTIVLPSRWFQSLEQTAVSSSARSGSLSPRGAQGPSLPTTVSTSSPRGLHTQTASAMSRIEEEQVENAFCLRVGSKTKGKGLFKTSGDVLSPFFSPSSIHFAAIRRFPSQRIL